MFSQRWLDRFFFSSPWRFSSFTSTLAKPGTAQIAQKVICFFLKPNQQINGLTFINQNTVQITPIKIIVWIAKLCHSIFQRQFDQSSPCCQLSVVNITIALSWSLFQNSGPIYCEIYFVYLYTALFTAGLFITGGSGEHKTSIEMFPATLCPVTPFPIPSFPTSLTGKGRYSHSLSVVDNGRKLVSCGGRHADGYSYSSLLLDRFIQKHCISWRSGQDKWTYERNLM